MVIVLDEAVEEAGHRLPPGAPKPRHLPEFTLIDEYAPSPSAKDQRPELWITDYFLIDLASL